MESCAIFNVDVNVGEDDFDYLRVVQNFEKTGTDENGETVEKPDYELQGFWDGFDEHTGLPGRNIRSLSEYKGRNMTLFKQAYSKELKKVSAHIAVTDIPVTEDMAVTKEPLPAGQYLYGSWFGMYSETGLPAINCCLSTGTGRRSGIPRRKKNKDQDKIRNGKNKDQGRKNR